MKLNEIKQLNESDLETDPNVISVLVAALDIRDDKWCFKGGRVSTTSDVFFFNSDLRNGHLPFQFSDVGGRLDLHNLHTLTSLEGCPDLVHGNVKIDGCKNLENFKFFPKKVIGDVIICNCDKITTINDLVLDMDGGFLSIECPITSLVGVGDINVILYDVCLEFDFNNVKVGGLGLILIKGLSDISDATGARLPLQFEIIREYLGKPDDIFECQAELIENNFEEYAQL